MSALGGWSAGRSVALSAVGACSLALSVGRSVGRSIRSLVGRGWLAGWAAGSRRSFLPRAGWASRPGCNGAAEHQAIVHEPRPQRRATSTLATLTKPWPTLRKPRPVWPEARKESGAARALFFSSAWRSATPPGGIEAPEHCFHQALQRSGSPGRGPGRRK